MGIFHFPLQLSFVQFGNNFCCLPLPFSKYMQNIVFPSPNKILLGWIYPGCLIVSTLALCTLKFAHHSKIFVFILFIYLIQTFFPFLGIFFLNISLVDSHMKMNLHHHHSVGPLMLGWPVGMSVVSFVDDVCILLCLFISLRINYFHLFPHITPFAKSITLIIKRFVHNL